MNGYERSMAALTGKPRDRVPVMLHNFMMAAREARITMRQYRESARAIADCFIATVERYDVDGLLVDVDTAVLAGAVGVPIDFPEDEPARCAGPAIDDLARVSDLAEVDLANDERVQTWLEAVRLLTAHFGDEVLIRGNCDQNPYSLACLMRSPDRWMMDLMDPGNRENAGRLIEYCAGVTEQFIELMVGTGSHVVSNGDSLAGPDMISPPMYRDLALSIETQVVEKAHALGVPYVLHVCGDTSLILEDMVTTGADALELDYKTDVALVRRVLDGRCTLIGNIDPSGVIAMGTAESVARKTRELCRTFADTPRFILNAGCAIPAETPPENIRAMIRASREF